jgi:hypothetical protein
LTKNWGEVIGIGRLQPFAPFSGLGSQPASVQGVAPCASTRRSAATSGRADVHTVMTLH